MARRIFPLPANPARATRFARAAHWLMCQLLRLLFRIEVRGLEHVPKQGPYVLIANHISRFDPLLLLSVLPLEPRVWFLSAAEHVAAIPWRRRFLRLTGGIIAIHHRNPRSTRRALRDAEQVIAAGGVVGIFPEGRVGSEEGRLQPVRPGASSLSLRTGVPIVPIWIAGAHRVYWRSRIQLVIGEPFYPPGGVSRADAASSLTLGLLRCRELSDPVEQPANPIGLWLNRLL